MPAQPTDSAGQLSRPYMQMTTYPEVRKAIDTGPVMHDAFTHYCLAYRHNWETSSNNASNPKRQATQGFGFGRPLVLPLALRAAQATKQQRAHCLALCGLTPLTTRVMPGSTFCIQFRRTQVLWPADASTNAENT